MNKRQACIKHGPPMFVSFHIFPVHHMSHQCHHHPMQNTYNGYRTCPPWLIPSPPMRNWGKGWSQGQRHTRRFESRTFYMYIHIVYLPTYTWYTSVCVPVVHHVCIWLDTLYYTDSCAQSVYLSALCQSFAGTCQVEAPCWSTHQSCKQGKNTHQSKNYTQTMQRWRKKLWWEMSTWARFHRWTPGRRTARTRRSPSQRKVQKKKNKTARPKKKTPACLHWPAPRQTKMPPQRCWTTKATENPKQNQGREGEEKKRKRTHQRITNATKHSLRAKPEDWAPHVPKHTSGGRPWVSHRNPSTPRCETKGLSQAKQDTEEKEKKRTQKAHMKKSNEQQQSDLRATKSTPTRRIGTNLPRRQDFTTTHYVSKKKANFFNLLRQQHMSVRPYPA